MKRQKRLSSGLIRTSVRLRKLDQTIQHPPGRAAIETVLGQPDAFRQGLGLAPNDKGGGGVQNCYVSATTVERT